jgi:hypothetical protein
METVIITSIVLIAIGALATFAIAQLLSEAVLSKAEEHGRFAGLANEDVSANPPDSARRIRKLRSDFAGRRQCLLVISK